LLCSSKSLWLLALLVGVAIIVAGCGDRFDREAGLGEARQEGQIPEPRITELEVHKLEWLG
jgi:hypothetical protein